MATNFEYPKMALFPPFYTKQPNADTWTKQQELWIDHIISYCKHHRIYKLPIDSKQKPFYNSEIKRSLSTDVITLILDSIVKQGKASWDKQKQNCTIYHYTLEEWASMIYKWVFDTGKTGTVCTLYEILHGDEVIDQDFYEADEGVIRKALDVLVKQGKATLFDSADGNMGIKFI